MRIEGDCNGEPASLDGVFAYLLDDYLVSPMDTVKVADRYDRPSKKAARTLQAPYDLHRRAAAWPPVSSASKRDATAASGDPEK
jgi:hypothetical protein